MQEKQRNSLKGSGVKILFSDIDGTLLNSRHQVPEATGQKIMELEKRGIPFILVSARMPSGVRLIQSALGTNSPIVCYSGGLILDGNGRIMKSCQVALDLAAEIKGRLEEQYPEICCNTYGMDQWAVDHDQNPWVIREERITKGKAAVGDIKTVFGPIGGIHKFLLMGAPEDIDGVSRMLKADYPELTIQKSNANYLEVMNGAVSKSVGVRFLCRYYGIPEELAAAFGDGENDIDMLQAVSYSFAMENAPESVRRQAAFVTSSNDDQGILEAIREL